MKENKSKSNAKNRNIKKKNVKKKKSRFKIIMGFLLFEIVFTGVTAPLIAYHGPFTNVRDTLVTTAMTTLSHQWIATTFLSEEKINEIMGNQAIKTIAQDNSKSGVVIEKKNDRKILLEEVNSNKFKGYLLTINDPTRLKVGYSSQLDNGSGELTSEIAINNDAIAAINGGGFTDKSTGEEWTGTGGSPTGLLMSNGKIVHNDLSSADEKRETVAFRDDGTLLVGNYSLNELQDQNVLNAVSFGPALIVNGEKTIGEGSSGGWGIAPRTAIGQKADGTILLLVIDGRQLTSSGATLKDAQDILYENGAVTASNLDGGSSSTMYYNGEVINSPSDTLGERTVPSVIYVEK